MPKSEQLVAPKEGYDCTFFLRCNEMAHKYMKEVIYPGSLDKITGRNKDCNILHIDSDEEQEDLEEYWVRSRNR